MDDPMKDYKASLQALTKFDFLMSDMSKFKNALTYQIESRKDLDVEIDNMSTF
jgi:hypothetical protein